MSGAAGAYVTLAQIAFVSALDDASRGRAFGVAASGVTVAQGLGIAASGAVTEVLAPHVTVALAGTAGLLAVCFVAARTRVAKSTALPAGRSPGPASVAV